jgi:hypothetical protein
MIILVPIRIVSESNLREHWSEKSRRHNQHKWRIFAAIDQFQSEIALPCVITLTRIAPRLLDDDNLRGALKHARDTIADFLIPGLAKGRADGDPRLKFEYGQEKGKPREYALKIEFINES